MTDKDQDIDTMLEESGNTLTAGAISGPCDFRDHDDVELEHDGSGGQLLLDTIVTVRRNLFTSVKKGDPVVLAGPDAKPPAGQNFIIINRRFRGDGMTDLWLQVA